MWTDLHRSTQRLLFVSFGALSGAIVILCATISLRYESSPGTAAVPPPFWPQASSIVRPQRKFSLVLFAHPDCPCTGASLTELARILTKVHGEVAAVVLFSKPGAAAAEAQNSDAWRKVASIPGVLVQFDDLARETTIFGAHVSGQVLLYAPNGRLRFTGGITAVRGHEGENASSDALIELVNNDRQGVIYAHVFGCSLEDPSRQELKTNTWWRKR
jgi:hypothetical protein